MKYMVGYQLQDSGALVDEIRKYKDKVYEVYFSWGDMPSGRGSAIGSLAMMPHEANRIQITQLKSLAEVGIGMNLLLNANCYGENSLAREFLISIGNLIDYLCEKINLQSVTTTSPIIARFIKDNFPEIKIRASVNMEIGTIEGMEYLAEVFDGYYYKRELNKDLNQVKRMKSWCDTNKKSLFMLANSGCLNYCSVRQFHDNLVAHEHQISGMDNGAKFESQCSIFLKKKESREEVLKYLNFVRPEEIELFEPYVTAAKLATRISSRPEKILRAYMNGTYGGNILELLEPNHERLFYPMIIDNSKLPDTYNHHVAACDKNCKQCGYCQLATANACVNLSNGGFFDVNQLND